MRKNLLGLSDDDWNIFGNYPIDVGFSLTLSIENNTANFNLGPMRVEQLTNYFESNEVKEKLPSTGLFIDFDLYRNEPDFSPGDYHKKFSTFLKKGAKQITEITEKLMDRYGAFK